MWLRLCERHLKNCYVKCVENDLQKMKLQKKHAKNTGIFLFPVKHIKIPDIFYKIQQFLTMSWTSVIAHKDLLL